jgi:hypothetical protein
MPFEPFGDLNNTPEEAIGYSEFYESTLKFHFSCHPGVEQFFTNARKVCDLACGRGASAIFIAKFCPQARIVTVDRVATPFPEIIQQLQGRHIRHERTSVSRFLKDTGDTFDIAFLVRAPNVIYPEDCVNLAKHIKGAGYVLELNDDE